MPQVTSSRPALAVRALVALVLMIGLYALALGVVVGLRAVVYLDVTDGGIHVQLVLGATIAMVLILVSIVPRPDKFEPQGIRLSQQEHPELFAEIDFVARATGQATPTEVYLINEVNAFVSQRGGIMGSAAAA